ncbi:integrase [Gossypium australe]|uniref:Integrase n=1 Tax=Gossypium australe TaxID=47621 RepID=A0A5B6VD21_9ROSI|nr:integrase [Gossypium australe]
MWCIMMHQTHDLELSLKYLITQKELNLRQHRKANVVADALSRKQMINLRAMFARLSLVDDGGLLAELQVKPTLTNEIKAKQLLDLVEDGKTDDYGFNDEGVLSFHVRYCMPNDRDLK